MVLLGRWLGQRAFAYTLKNMNKVLTITAALAAGLLVLAAPAGASTPKHTPIIGSTVTIHPIRDVSGSYSVPLLQAYTTELYGGGPYGTHPVIFRVRLSDTGSTSFDQDPQSDSAVLLLGHYYPTSPIVEYDQSGWPWPVWQLTTDYLSDTGNGFLDSVSVGGAGLGGCPTPTSLYPNLYESISNVRTFGPMKLIRRSAGETCVVFSLPRQLDRTTMKFCWTPDAGEALHQPTYCWTVDNDKPGAF
jgi:hypothetical protein